MPAMQATLQVSVVVIVDGVVVTAVAAKAACFLCMLSQQERAERKNNNKICIKKRTGKNTPIQAQRVAADVQRNMFTFNTPNRTTEK